MNNDLFLDVMVAVSDSGVVAKIQLEKNGNIINLTVDEATNLMTCLNKLYNLLQNS